MADTDRPVVTVYPDQSRYEVWVSEANENQESISNYIQRMVSTGRNDLDPEIDISKPEYELRRETKALREKLEQERKRVKRLEGELDNGIRHVILSFIEENPGADFTDICQEIENHISNLVVEYTEELEVGDFISVEQGEYYYTGENQHD